MALPSPFLRRLRLRSPFPALWLAVLMASGCGPSGGDAAGGEPSAEAPAADGAPASGRLWLVGPDGGGEITAATTEADLVRRFGATQVRRAEVALAEGETAEGTLLFPDDSTRRAEIVWMDRAARARPELVALRGDTSAWAVAPGVTLGTTLTELERLNGGPFTVSGFEWDYGGIVTSWERGRLEALARGPGRVHVTLGMPEGSAASDEEWAGVSGEGVTVRSDSPVLRRLNPRVNEITLSFEMPAGAEAPGGETGAQDAPGLDAARVPATGASVQAFVPAGWVVASQADGDLDGDRRTDRVVHLVEEGTHYDPAAVSAAPEAHALLVLLADAGGGLRRAGLATRLLQPVVPQYGLELTVEDGVLTVGQNYGMTQVMDVTHRFRHEPASGRFLLVRRERFYYTRPISREDTSRTVDDYLKGVRTITVGHVRNGEVVKESTTRERLPAGKLYFDDVDEIPE